MDESVRRTTEGIAKAIQAEADGYHFYMMAARTTKDPKGREVFETLAREELDHQQFLRTQYKALSETGKPDSRVHLGNRTDLSGMSPIFSEQIQSRVREAHYEMSALSIGIQLELSSIKFYQEEAKAASDAFVQTFYTELVEWETGHYRALLRQQEALKESYWSESGFAPF
ncbi:MAG: ferritin family protein [bacterium]